MGVPTTSSQLRYVCRIVWVLTWPTSHFTVYGSERRGRLPLQRRLLPSSLNRAVRAPLPDLGPFVRVELRNYGHSVAERGGHVLKRCAVANHLAETAFDSGHPASIGTGLIFLGALSRTTGIGKLEMATTFISGRVAGLCPLVQVGRLTLAAGCVAWAVRQKHAQAMVKFRATELEKA